MKIDRSLSESAALAELGERAQQYRVGMNLTQAELATRAGISRRTLERLESGSSVQSETLLRVMRALGLFENLDQFIPEADVRPIRLAASKTELRRRSSKPRSDPGKTGSWQWGDKK